MIPYNTQFIYSISADDGAFLNMYQISDYVSNADTMIVSIKINDVSYLIFTGNYQNGGNNFAEL